MPPGSGLRVSLTDGLSTIGGGSAPGSGLPTCLVVVEKEGWPADRLEQALREAPMPVIARIDADRVVLDLRTVREDEDSVLVEQLRRL